MLRSTKATQFATCYSRFGHPRIETSSAKFKGSDVELSRDSIPASFADCEWQIANGESLTLNAAPSPRHIPASLHDPGHMAGG
jgi:hypothetical protein